MEYLQIAAVVLAALALAGLGVGVALDGRNKRELWGRMACLMLAQREVQQELAAIRGELKAAAERDKALRDRVDECFDVTFAKLDMLTPDDGWETEDFCQSLGNILGYGPERRKDDEF